MEVKLSQVLADAPKSLENAEGSSPGSEESSPEESEESKVEPKVPDQLVMEFLINMMKKDYGVAQKLCQMILLYDPENEHALSFKPLLQEMVQAVKDNAENNDDNGSESETEDSSESDSDENNSGSDTDSKESDSDSGNET